MTILAAVAVPHPPLIFPEVGLGKEKNIQKENESFQTFHKTMILKQLLLDCLFYDLSRIESKNVMNINRSFILY